VREYNVLQHSYGAEYGKRAGGQVTVVSSSGTNQWHGDLFGVTSATAFLDARNFSRTPRAVQGNQFEERWEVR